MSNLHHGGWLSSAECSQAASQNWSLLALSDKQAIITDIISKKGKNMKPIDSANIDRIMHARQILEVEVAKSLYRHFNKYFSYTLRKMVLELADRILSVPENDLNRAILRNEGCRGLLVWKRRAFQPSHAGMRRLRNISAQWTLDDFSDIIRLSGELAEVLKKDFVFWASRDQEKSKLRPEPTFMQPGKGTPIKNGGLGKEFGHRHRSTVPESKQVIRDQPYSDIRNLNSRPFPSPYKPLVRGVERFQFEPKSVIAAMDRTFGLKPEGGDVSGTTTDSIHFIQWSGTAVHVSPETLNALQLLPIVTMVSQGHHSLLECAYPLSRHGYMDYHIGYYDTLVPQAASDSIKADLRKAVGPYERDQRNKHVLVWGSGVQKQGVQLEGEEIGQFKKMTRALTAYGFCVTGGLVDYKDALNVVKTFCPPVFVAKFMSLEGEVGLSGLEQAFRKRGLR